MPKQLLIETLHESSALHISAVLNGLHHNSMQETAAMIMALTKEVPTLQLQIDPTIFERFDVHQVPALVVEKGPCFDVLYGNISLKEGLKHISQKGACR